MPGTPEDHYRGEAGQRYQQQKRAVPDAAAPWVCRLRAEKLRPFVGLEDTVVELGVGLGWNLAALRCAARIGTDLEDFLPAELKKSGVEFRRSSSELPNGMAGAVILHHVLEHVENPPEMLREALRILRPGGRALIFVPYEKEARYRHFDPAEPNHHLYSWNVQTLGNLVAAARFTIVEARVHEFGYDRFAAKTALRMHFGERGFRVIRRIAHLLRPGREVRVIARKDAVGGKA
jgi:SAM-dependent methyltransferase